MAGSLTETLIEGFGSLSSTYSKTGWASVAFVIISIHVLIRIRGFVRDRRESLSKGCAPPPSYPHADGILGLKHLFSLIAARKEKRLLGAFSEIFSGTRPDANTVAYYTLGKKSLWTRDPENIRAILSAKFKDWSLPPARVAAFTSCWGGGIFAADGVEWEHSRAMLRPSFNRSQVQDVELLEKHTQNLISRIPNAETVDLAELFPLLTMDITSELLFGESTGCLNSANSESGMRFTTAFNYVMQKMCVRVSLPFLAKLPDPSLKRSVKYINSFMDDFVNRALSLRDQGSKTERDGTGKYVFLEELAKADCSAELIRAQLLSIMVAGRDTTASLLSIIWWHLARRPEVVERLRGEIRPLGAMPPSAKDLKTFEYLKAVINEVLRLYPINPINSRAASCDTTLPRGGGSDGESPVFIKKGQQVIFSSSALHRRSDIYGEDSLEFNPDRWLSHRPATWEFIPFGGGPRVCIGQELAVTEAAYTTVRLLQEFAAIDPRSEGRFQEMFAMALNSGDGCKVSLSRSG